METEELITADCVDSKDEDISESFICCVCLDLLYKPIVLACGHASCFWCVHMSMSGHGESSCPVCRNSYRHFPTICEVLHILIVKMYPNAYHRRDTLMLEEEKRMDSFSPKFDINSLKTSSVSDSACSSAASSKLNLPTEVSNLETDCSVAATEENNRISITDVLCPTCKNLMFRPVVLNCGHAYCETCIINPDDDSIMCSICKSPHPTDFLKVCVDLNNFLEKTFPEDYMARRDSIERRRADLQQQPPVASSSRKKSDSKDVNALFLPLKHLLDWLSQHGPKVHIGVGCDYCGVLPIIGTRYRCKDCKEKVGFDLCEKCYNTQSKLPGRFNQQHTEEHKFEILLKSEVAQNWMRMNSEARENAANNSEEFEPEYAEIGMMDIVADPLENAADNSEEDASANGDQSNDS